MNIYVKQKEIAITVGIGSKLFEIWMWLWGVIPAIICFAAKTPIYIPVIVLVVGALPGIIFQVKKVKAKNALDTQMINQSISTRALMKQSPHIAAEARPKAVRSLTNTLKMLINFQEISTLRWRIIRTLSLTDISRISCSR